MTTTEQTEQDEGTTYLTQQGYIQWGIPGVAYSAVRVPVTADPETTARWIGQALEAMNYLQLQMQPEPTREPFEAPRNAPQRPAAPQQRPQQARGQSGPARGQGGAQGGRGGQRTTETRADKYPEEDGLKCDQCGGPVGRYPQTGRMPADKAVCLSRCMDGQYIHTVLNDDGKPIWLDDEDDAPF